MLDLNMSPYAAFVWPAWGISAVALAALAVRAIVVSHRWRRELDRLEKTSEPRPHAVLGAAEPKEGEARLQAAGSAAGPTRPQAAQGAVGPKK